MAEKTLTYAQVEEILDSIEVPDCKRITGDNKRCEVCQPCEIWAFYAIDVREPFEKVIYG